MDNTGTTSNPEFGVRSATTVPTWADNLGTVFPLIRAAKWPQLGSRGHKTADRVIPRLGSVPVPVSNGNNAKALEIY